MEQIKNDPGGHPVRLSITGLAEIRARLAQVRPEDLMATALADQAERMAPAVRQSLSEPQGAGAHDKPWTSTGALRDSITATANGLEAAIGSDQTPWSGNHRAIKEGIQASPTDDTRISPTGDVWSQNPDGSWTNHGPAANFIGSSRPGGRKEGIGDDVNA